ncbi:MAG: hypothetical protein KatS3mg111_2555 [Pirellulaceae bacterium]|nr:MAG: hypothetical protein KatS3mg111_2555 [Pirellulaceae bacterium]
MLADRRSQFTGEITSGAVWRQCGVQYMDALPGKMVSEVTHGTEEQHDPSFVRPDMVGFFRHLRHPYGIATGVKSVENRRGGIELVAKDQDQVSH